MGVTINLSSGGKMSSLLANNSMLKSTREKFQRQAQRDSKVAFFEAQKENLKKTEASDIEGIAKKLELFHSYEDEISAAKQEYNNSQMFHTMDEAMERGEKLAEAAKKNKPKTEEERKKDAIEETSGEKADDGMLSEIMDSLDEVQKKQLEAAEVMSGQNEDALLQDSMKDDILSETENMDNSAENVVSASYEEQENYEGRLVKNGNVIPAKYNHKAYIPFDVRV